jgi:putative hydrolase of the HAD superfamily
MRYQAVLFDLDNTLYDYNACYRAANDVLFPWLEERTGRPRAELEPLYREAKRRNHVALAGTAASHNRLLYYQRLAELLGLNVFGTADVLLNIFWDAFLAHIRPLPGALELLEAIRPRGICLVTDMTAEIQYRKVARLGIAPFIDAIVTSEEAGVEKPHPWSFYLALRKLGARAEEACMVGDDFTKDVEGPLLAGLDAYWVQQCTLNTHREFAHPRVTIVQDLYQAKAAIFG